MNLNIHRSLVMHNMKVFTSIPFQVTRGQITLQCGHRLHDPTSIRIEVLIIPNVGNHVSRIHSHKISYALEIWGLCLLWNTLANLGRSIGNLAIKGGHLSIMFCLFVMLKSHNNGHGVVGKHSMSRGAPMQSNVQTYNARVIEY